MVEQRKTCDVVCEAIMATETKKRHDIEYMTGDDRLKCTAYRMDNQRMIRIDIRVIETLGERLQREHENQTKSVAMPKDLISNLKNRRTTEEILKDKEVADIVDRW
jgi:hypothetical protein